MPLYILVNGKPIEVPREVEARGAAAVEEWLQNRATQKKPAKPPAKKET